MCNKSGLTAPVSLSTCPMCEEQRWIFNVPTKSLSYTGPRLELDPKGLEILGFFCQFDPSGTRSANHMIDSLNLSQLRHPDTLIYILYI